jgi:hypothetical protein
MSDGVEKATSRGSHILQTHMDVMARIVLARSDEIVWLGDKSVIDPRNSPLMPNTSDGLTCVFLFALGSNSQRYVSECNLFLWLGVSGGVSFGKKKKNTLPLGRRQSFNLHSRNTRRYVRGRLSER